MIRWRNRCVRSSRGAANISVGRARLQDPARVEEADAVRDVPGEAHLVGRDEHRHAARRELADHVEDLGDELRVECAGDLVKQQEVGLHRERPDDRHPLLLAAREAVRVVVALGGEPEPVEQLHRPGLGLGPRRPSTLRGASVTLSSTDMCGNRLNAWNTIPIRRRIRLTSTPFAVISSPPMKIRPASIGSRRLMQRSSVDLPHPDAPMRQTTSCSATSRSIPRRTSRSPNDLWRPSMRSARRGRCGAVAQRRPSAAWRAAVPRDQPVGQPRHRDRDDQEHERGGQERREVERPAAMIWACRKISTTPMNDTSAVSFWRPMKSFSSGGMTRRTACGTMTYRSDWSR